MPNPLAEFEHPPLDEVVLGVQFEPLAGFHAAHLGLYWAGIRDRYPATEEQPPLVSQVESDQLTPTANMAVAFGFPACPRAWFLDETGNQLIQVQRDRFLRNWRQLQGTEKYPRYSHLVREFRQEWEGFLAFLEKQGLGRPHINQCELTYVNNLLPGNGWKDPSDLAKVFTVLKPRSETGFLPAPEVLAMDASFQLPDGRGRLRVTIQPAFRARDLKMMVVLNLTARGAPPSGDAEQLVAWFDTAHEWIVRGFDELTTPEMHRAWGKKS